MTPDAASFARVSVVPRTGSDGIHDVLMAGSVAQVVEPVVRLVCVGPVADVRSGRSGSDKRLHDQMMNKSRFFVEDDELVPVRCGSGLQQLPLDALLHSRFSYDLSVKGLDSTKGRDLVSDVAHDWHPFLFHESILLPTTTGADS